MATGALDSNGIWQYGEDDSETTFSALLNKLGSSTSTTVTRLEEMGGITSTQAATARNNLRVGLVPLSPSNVVIASGTGSVNSLGVISFNAATSVSLDNVFTTEYNNYKIILKSTSASTTLEFWSRLRSSGTDASGSNYFRGGSYTLTNGSLTQTSANGSNVFFLGATANGVGQSATVIEIQSPRLSEDTIIHSTHYGFFSGWGATFVQAGKHGLANSYDGFTLIASAGNMTGTIQVFGYND